MNESLKYDYETKIYSKDKKIEKVFSDKEFLEKINQCEHITALYNKSKETIREIEKTLSPLRPQASSLLIETRGGNVIATMSLADFFSLLNLGKRITVTERYPDGNLQEEGIFVSTDEEIDDLLRQLDSE